MQVAELTLDAALRDASSERAEARHKAIRNLAPALLEGIETTGPRWRADREHDQGSAVRHTLVLALSDDDPAIRGMAAVGLGTIGDPEIVPRVSSWIDDPSDDEAVAFLRQCAVITVSLVGAAAGHDAGEDRREREAARDEAAAWLRRALRNERADVRFQAAIGLVEVCDAQAESTLLGALASESEAEVRENIVAALSRIDPPQAETCDAMAELLRDDPDANGALGYEAAMILAAARRDVARPRLLAALDHPGQRDRALEALAVLGPAPATDRARVHRMATALLTPGVTRVRAAYALSRMTEPGPGPDPGRALLAKLRFHPRAAVREAVRDALALLGPG